MLMDSIIDYLLCHAAGSLRQWMMLTQHYKCVKLSTFIVIKVTEARETRSSVFLFCHKTSSMLQKINGGYTHKNGTSVLRIEAPPTHVLLMDICQTTPSLGLCCWCSCAAVGFFCCGMGFSVKFPSSVICRSCSL